MTRQATAATPAGPEQSPTRLPPCSAWLLMWLLAGLTACASPPAEPIGDTQKSSGSAGSSVSTTAKQQQPVGYDVRELQRRLVSMLATLETFEDVQPRSVQRVLGLDLQPRAEQPLSLEGIGKLSNGWVFNVWAWQTEPNAAPPAPLQLFFYPGGDVDPSLWVDSPCFLDIAGMLAGLRTAGYTVIGEHSNFPLHSFQLVRTTLKAEFTVSVGDYLILRGPLEGTRCLSKLTVMARSPSSPQ